LAKANKVPNAANVFRDKTDPTYRRLLGLVREGKKQLDEITRFDMPDFRPAGHYLREMQRYGILPPGFDAGGPIDAYRTDQAYWRSLWYRPVGVAGNPLR